MASNFLRYGTGRTPFTNGDGRKEPYRCGNSDILEDRCGVRVFRHGLVDNSAKMPEAVTDDQIRGSDGVRNMMQLFDDHHAPYQKIPDHEDFERADYRYERPSTETYTAYVTKKRELSQTLREGTNIKNFFEDGDRDENDGMLSSEDLDWEECRR